MNISRSETDDRTTWTLIIGGVEVAHLSVWSENGEIAHVETYHPNWGKGFARTLYEHAQTDLNGGIYHTIGPHLTEYGRGFAGPLGGPTHHPDVHHVEQECHCYYCERRRSTGATQP
jgi:hypothetical protein